MNASNCFDADALASLLDGEAAEAPECVEHLETCAYCRQTLADLAADHATWQEMARRLPQLSGACPGRLPCEPALERVIARLKNEAPTLTATTEAVAEEALPPGFLRTADRPGLLGYLGAYEVREVIGRGGMGIVFKAFDPALHRMVAIKVLAPQMAGSATARKRFLREGRAAAAVTHDHVVSIHEVNESAGLPYLVMQYVAGTSLQDKLDVTGPLPVLEILRIGMQVADGLAAAHAQGLVHRDIKPANILLENGVERVKITDFGLARAVDDASCTRSGVVTGTPAYTAPEQARAEPVDARSDLFSLGSVLYALCTGRPPFRGDSAVAVLRRVSDDTPTPIRTLNPDIPDWLEEIVTTLHAKDPARRFGSAAELALLLGQHLGHLQHPTAIPQPPRLARPGRPRTSSRRRATLAVTLLIGLVVLVACVVSAGSGVPASRNQPQPQGDKDAQPTQTNGGNVLTTSRSVWHLTTRLSVASGAISPDGKTLVTGTWDGSAVFWDVATGKERLTLAGYKTGLRALAISPDSKTVATAAGDRIVRLWDSATGKPKGEFKDYAGRIMGLAFSPDGKFLATAGGDFGQAGELKLWDLTTGKESVKLAPFARELWGLAYSPDGESVAVAVGDGRAQIIDRTTGKVRASFKHASYVRRVAYSPDGKILAVTYGEDGYVALWDVASGKERSSFQAHQKPLFGIEFSRDGKQLVTCGVDGTALIWDVTKPQVKRTTTIKAHVGQTWFAVFFPDGKTVATGGTDRTIKLWTVGE